MKTSKYTSTKWMAGLGVVCMLSVLLLSSCLKNNKDSYQPPVAYVSFVQASSDEPPMDIYLNNSKVNQTPIGYGSILDYFRAYTGTRTVNLYKQGTMSKILSDSVNLKPNVTYSLFLTNTAAKASLLLLTDTLNHPEPLTGSIRFVNLGPDAPAVDFAITDSAAMVSNRSFKGFSSFLPIPGGKTYNFEVRQHGTNTVLATLDKVYLNNGLVYTVWLHGLINTTDITQKLSLDIQTNAYFN
ncbi:MAG TPA: DUF4397 domain-containing protein [Mucilaginibacter sp.]